MTAPTTKLSPPSDTKLCPCSLLLGVAKKVGPLCLKAHIISLHLRNESTNFLNDFWLIVTLQCHFILNRSVDSKFIKSVKHYSNWCRNFKEVGM